MASERSGKLAVDWLKSDSVDVLRMQLRNRDLLLRAVIAYVGGTVTVPRSLMFDPPQNLTMLEDFESSSIKIAVFKDNDG